MSHTIINPEDRTAINLKDNVILQVACQKACAGIIAQGRQAVNPKSSICQYRQPCEGGVLKCAIGQLLSDDQIKKYAVVEGRGPHDFPGPLVAELLPGITDIYRAKLVLVALQHAHDNAETANGMFLEDFKARANNMAKVYGMDPIA
jgi:hypothetical protein